MIFTFDIHVSSAAPEIQEEYESGHMIHDSKEADDHDTSEAKPEMDGQTRKNKEMIPKKENCTHESLETALHINSTAIQS